MEYYKALQLYYEKCLEEHGATAKGMDWPNPEDLVRRFNVLMDIAQSGNKVSLLDLGCGVGLLVDHLGEKTLLDRFEYTGADISPKMIAVARERHPSHSFEVRDTLINPYGKDRFDYVLMNGVLTEKHGMSQSQMIEFAKEIIQNAYQSCKYGVAFNIMSSHVDWKREDLFHWELDDIVSFMVKNCSRKIRIMMDYGLYEYTVHLKKEHGN
ncbi:class I SAM-dependent methyltransferase [soil metagenome]